MNALDSNTLLNHAIRIARKGEKEDARHLLQQVLRVDETNERAWLWLAFTYSADDKRIKVLRRCLRIIPECEAAQQGIQEILDKQSEQAPILQEQIVYKPSQKPVAKPTKNKGRKKVSLNRTQRALMYLAGIIVVVILIVGGYLLLMS